MDFATYFTTGRTMTKLYSRENNGTFTDIECPILFPEDKPIELKSHLKKAGFSLNTVLEDQLEIYKANNAMDCDYEYMVLIDVCFEGHIVFFKEVWDLTHFINNHTQLIKNTQLDYILNKLNDIETMIFENID